MKILNRLFRCKICLCLLLLIVFNSIVKAQVNNTGIAYISGNVYVNSNFTNASTASYQNDGNFYLTGNFINDQASMAEGTGATQFIGSGLQNLNGSQTPVFHDVYLNNFNGVKMNLNATMGGTIYTVTGSLFFNSYALTMGGKISTSYTNTSAFNVTSTSDLILNGDAAAGNGLYFDPSANTIHNVTVGASGTGALGNALNITPGSSFGTVMVDGSFNAAGFLTIKSDSVGTARIAESAGNITNNVTVERYIPPRRAWRFMSVPVNNDTLHIRSAWQEGANNPTLYIRYDPKPGYGTHITGDNNTSAGFDFNTTYNASIKTWVQSTNSWSIYAPSTLYTLINDYDGYCIFIRGSRAVDLAQATNAIADPTIIRTTGKVNNRGWSKAYSSVIANDIFLVGNPYVSSVDIASMLSSSTGIYHNKFWVWDPGLSGNYSVGGYIAYSNGVMAPLTTNYPAPTTIIQANQAFLVQANTAGDTIKFKQNDKTASESAIFSKGLLKSFPVLYANLTVPSGSNYLLIDGVAAGFNNKFSADVDGDDATKLWNFYENIALVRKVKTMAIELRPMPVLTDTIFLRMYLRQQPYAMQLCAKNFEGQPVRAWIVDKYLNTKTELNFADANVYNFSPNPDTNSYRNRFMIIFNRQLITNPQPVSQLTNQSDPLSSGNANAVGAKKQNLAIFPNPVTGKAALLELNNFARGDYELSLYSLKGQKLASQKIQHNGANTTYNFNLPGGIAAGTYNLQVLNDNNIVLSAKLVVSK